MIGDIIKIVNSSICICSGNLDPSMMGNFRPISNLPFLGKVLEKVNFNTHINNVTKIAFFHLRNIARIRAYLSLEDAKTLIHAFVFSRLHC